MKESIVVTGDVLVDHHIYEGERKHVGARRLRGLRCVREIGGAMLIPRLFEALKGAEALHCEEHRRLAAEAVTQHEEHLAKAKQFGDPKPIADAEKEMERAKKERDQWSAKPLVQASWECKLGVTQPPPNDLPCGHHALATWKPFPLVPQDRSNEEQVWRAGLLLGFGHDEESSDLGSSLPAGCDKFEPEPLSDIPDARVLVLDDGGFIFRHSTQKHCWLLPTKPDALDWILLKVSSPVTQSDLWAELSRRNELADRLVVVVPVHELRGEWVNLRRSLSWESAAENLREALMQSDLLRPLATVPCHLIVSFHADGALWLDNSNRDEPVATLVYDAARTEGEWASPLREQGESFGYLSVLSTRVLWELVGSINASCSPDLATAIAAGLRGMRNLRRKGHGLIANDSEPNGFPAERLASVLLKPARDFAFARVPWTPSDQQPYTHSDRLWRIFEASQVPFHSGKAPSMLGLARQLVIQGEAAFRQLPHAYFGELLTLDREEMEALRTLRAMMLDYKANSKGKKPLSIGVFGPPGAGKSFGVEQIATDENVFGKDAWMEFNLSQFDTSSDLIGAFHQVRDRVLDGITPVVFWDEFDSRNYHWLQYLLAPMQDGRFQEGQRTHPIGKCVFIFAGGTSHTFEAFCPDSSDQDATREFRIKKGPDFHSRLDAYLNVLGPNQRKDISEGRSSNDSPPDPSDICAPIRRAIMIRAHLGAKGSEPLDIDRPMLDALLTVPRYKHGARSLEKLVLALKPAKPSDPIRRSDLPPPGIIAMHVTDENGDPYRLIDLIEASSNQLFNHPDTIEELAAHIHAEWWGLAATKQPHLDKHYQDLTEAEKGDNRAAARRIPDILALVGLTIHKADNPATADAVLEHLNHHEELLAEAEHDGWMRHKFNTGWTYDPIRHDTKRRHNLLIPYRDLPEDEKDKDRQSVRKYPAHLMRAGYEIAFV